MNICIRITKVIVKLKETLSYREVGEQQGRLINAIFFKGGAEWVNYHERRERKGYTFSPLISVESNQTQNTYAKGAIVYFWVTHEKDNFAILLENYLNETNIMKTLDVESGFSFKHIATDVSSKGLNKLKVATPILLNIKENHYAPTFLERNSTLKQREQFLSQLNTSFIVSYNKTHEDKIKEDYRFFTTIEKERCAYVTLKRKKLLGTRGILTTTDEPRLVKHALTYGLGLKCAYLGTGHVEKRVDFTSQEGNK